MEKVKSIWSFCDQVSVTKLNVDDGLFDELKKTGFNGEEAENERIKIKNKYLNVLINSDELTDVLKKEGYVLEKKTIGAGGFGSVYNAKKIGERDDGIVVKIASFRNSGLLKTKKDYLFEEGSMNKQKFDIIDQQLQIFCKECEIMYGDTPKKGFPDTNGMSPLVFLLVNENSGKKHLIDFILCLPMRKYYSIETNKPWKESEVLKLTTQILECLQDAHGKYIHRDIKPENILTDNNGNYVLIDWGGAKIKYTGQTMMFKEATSENMQKQDDSTLTNQTDSEIEDICPRFVLSRYYCDPERYEQILDGDYEENSKIDVYSVGVVMAMLLYGNRSEFESGRFFSELSRGKKNFYLDSDKISELKCSGAIKNIIIGATNRTGDTITYETADEMLSAIKEKQHPVTAKNAFCVGMIAYIIALVCSMMAGASFESEGSAQLLLAICSATALLGIGSVAQRLNLHIRLFYLKLAGVIWLINNIVTFSFSKTGMQTIPAVVNVLGFLIIVLGFLIGDRITKNSRKAIFSGFGEAVLKFSVIGAAIGLCAGLTFSSINVSGLVGMFSGGTIAITGAFGFAGLIIGATVKFVISVLKISFSSKF